MPLSPSNWVSLKIRQKGIFRLSCFGRECATTWREGRSARDLADNFAQSYVKSFCNLREEIKEFNGFRNLKDWNYDASKKYPTTASDKLSDNLCNTEIDIVLETPRRLFIGEAKGESDLGAGSQHVLVHQLIRQYVMAKTLIDLIPEARNKRVVPFVVGDSDKLASLKNTIQVKFMLKQGWLKRTNILSWNDIERLGHPTARQGQRI